MTVVAEVVVVELFDEVFEEKLYQEIKGSRLPLSNYSKAPM